MLVLWIGDQWPGSSSVAPSSSSPWCWLACSWLADNRKHRAGYFHTADTCLTGYPHSMIKWIGDFFEWFADRVPHIPRPFNQLWEALGRTDPQAPPGEGGESDASSSSD